MPVECAIWASNKNNINSNKKENTKRRNTYSKFEWKISVQIKCDLFYSLFSMHCILLTTAKVFMLMLVRCTLYVCIAWIHIDSYSHSMWNARKNENVQRLFSMLFAFSFFFVLDSWVFVLNLNWCWIWNNKNSSKIIYCEPRKSGLWSPRGLNVNCECIDFHIIILFADYLWFTLIRLMCFFSFFIFLVQCFNVLRSGGLA